MLKALRSGPKPIPDNSWTGRDGVLNLAKYMITVIRLFTSLGKIITEEEAWGLEVFDDLSWSEDAKKRKRPMHLVCSEQITRRIGLSWASVLREACGFSQFVYFNWTPNILLG